jgi:hypothetical protein
VSAALWVFPTLIALFLTRTTAIWILDKFARRLAAGGYALSSNFRLAVSLGNINYRYESAVQAFRLSHPFLASLSGPEFLLAWVLTLILAIVQSYRMFRRPLPSGTLSVPGKLGLLVLPAFLFCLLGVGSQIVTWAAGSGAAAQVAQTELAIYYLLAENPNIETGHPLYLTEQDLGHSRYFGRQGFSANTLRFLRNAHIEIVPLGRRLGNPQIKEWYFVATIRLESGTELTLSRKPANDHAPGYQLSDDRVRWPGATHDEPLREW